MSEPMTIRVETWAVAADRAGVWLVGGDAWTSRLPVMADNHPDFDVQMALFERDAVDECTLVHSTSWRVRGPHMITTYVAALRVDSEVYARWPGARPISLRLVEGAGPATWHGPLDTPQPRDIDVLRHGLRHFRFLMDSDTTSAEAMPAALKAHLEPLTGALAGMYEHVRDTAVEVRKIAA